MRQGKGQDFASSFYTTFESIRQLAPVIFKELVETPFV